MRADHDIDLTNCQSKQDIRLLTRRPEPRKHLYFYGERGQALQERFIMLLRKNRCWYKDHDLLAIHYRFEGGAQG